MKIDNFFRSALGDKVGFAELYPQKPWQIAAPVPESKSVKKGGDVMALLIGASAALGLMTLGLGLFVIGTHDRMAGSGRSSAYGSR